MVKGLSTTGSKDKKDKQAAMLLVEPIPALSKVTQNSETEPPTPTSTGSTSDTHIRKPSRTRTSKASIINGEVKTSSSKGITSKRSRRRTVSPVKGNRSRKRRSKSRKRIKEETQTPLGSDMAVLAEAFNLNMNTKTMLVVYDGTTLEDFCLMTDDDFDGLIARARTTDRALPPLQIRKVQVLREWVQQELIKQPTEDASSQPESDNKESLIPKDWKARFEEDLPRLKQNLKAKGESPTAEASPSWWNYFISLKAMFC
jgi:hypothetical protein